MDIMFSVLRAVTLSIVSFLVAVKAFLLIKIYLLIYIHIILAFVSPETKSAVYGIINGLTDEKVFLLSLYACIIFMFCSNLKFVSIFVAYITGNSMMKSEDRVRVYNILKELFENASAKGFERVDVDDITIMVDKYNPDVNAWVYGDRVMCFTQRALDECKGEYEFVLRGLIAHEVGHIVQPHAKMLQYILSCEWFLHLLSWPLRLNVWMFSGFTRTSSKFLNTIFIIWLLPAYFVLWLIKIINFLDNISIYRIRRYYEYSADKVALDLGAGEGLLVFLQLVSSEENTGNFFTELFDTHPLTRKRMKKLAQGADFQLN